MEMYIFLDLMLYRYHSQSSEHICFSLPCVFFATVIKMKQNKYSYL